MADHTRDPTVEPPPDGRSPTGWDPGASRWTHDTLRRAVVHGVRLFNAAAYHEAHDCFEAEWYNYGRGTTESAFLHGLVQVAGGGHKWAAMDDRRGTASLLRTARQYLAGVPDDFYGVDVPAVRERAGRAVDEPAAFEDWHITLDGGTPTAGAGDYAYVASLP
ncbi:MAG: DUF309 domain-containing protein [Halobacteriales archaeon]